MATNLSLNPKLIEQAVKMSGERTNSVWSLAFRRDIRSSAPEVDALRGAIDGGDAIVSTGLILQTECTTHPGDPYPEHLAGTAPPETQIRSTV